MATANLKIKNPVFRNPNIKLSNSIDIEVNGFKSLILFGMNGSGKSTMADVMLSGMQLESGELELTVDGKKLYYDEIAQIQFRDVNNLTASPDNYYQKRWNATENEDCLTVTEILGAARVAANGELIDKLGIRHILDKHIIQISSGELRKLLIIRALMKKPKLLFIDNPYIGLDADSRDTVNGMLNDIAKEYGTVVIMTLCNTKDLDPWMEQMVLMENMDVKGVCAVADYVKSFEGVKAPEPVALPLTKTPFDEAYENAIVMNNVNVRYYGKNILKDVCWTVKQHDRWALMGENGAGKSTLLSLVSADNPQSYANDIALFDVPRGTGETIWDIKKRIGYLTPDMHTFYQEDIDCLYVVGTGFLDTVGLYIKPSEEQCAQALKWMEVFGIAHLAKRGFLKLSYGEQRAVLLCRVMVKEPELLILDEPLHGLDEQKKLLAKTIIEQYVEKMNPTLIYVTHYKNEVPALNCETKFLKRNR